MLVAFPVFSLQIVCWLLIQCMRCVQTRSLLRRQCIRVSYLVQTQPDWRSVCSVRKRNPRISESAIFETQFLFPVVLEITCHWTETLMNALPCHQQNQLFAIFTMDRVRTDIWIQHSRLFPHYIFPKQSFLFPDSKLSNRWLIQTLKNAGTKLVFKMQTYGRDWIRFDQNDKRKNKTFIKHLL